MKSTSQWKKFRQPQFLLAALFVFALCFFTLVSLKVVDWFTDEDRDYRLSDELYKLAGEIKQYKQQHGQYPAQLSDVRSSDQLCVTMVYPKCRRVHYKPSADLQDFRMAIKSFTWPILYYHPEASKSSEELSHMTEEERQYLSDKYHYICTFCMSYPPGSGASNATDQLPIYRETQPLFANPDEWPEL